MCDLRSTTFPQETAFDLALRCRAFLEGWRVSGASVAPKPWRAPVVIWCLQKLQLKSPRDCMIYLYDGCGSYIFAVFFDDQRFSHIFVHLSGRYVFHFSHSECKEPDAFNDHFSIFSGIYGVHQIVVLYLVGEIPNFRWIVGRWQELTLFSDSISMRIQHSGCGSKWYQQFPDSMR